MSEPMADVLASDTAVNALAERRYLASDDALLDLLGEWVDEIDANDETVLRPLPAATSYHPRLPVARTAAALAVAITLSSSGIAAAVNGDPFAPLHYVVTKISKLGHGDDSTAPNPFDAREALLERSAPPLVEKRAGAADRAPTSRQSDRPKVTAPATTASDEQLVATVSEPAGGDATTGDTKPPPVRPQRVIEVPDPKPGGEHTPRPGGDDPAPSPRPQGVPRPPLPDNPPIPIPDKPGSTDPPPAD